MKKGRLHLKVLPQIWHDRPKTRGECEPWSADERMAYEATGKSDRCFGFRPCPFVGCSMHLGLMIHAQSGDLRLHPRLVETDPALETLPATCALDVADDGASSMMRIGALMGTTEEYTHQLFQRAKAKGRRS